jgi:hypothetical protein
MRVGRGRRQSGAPTSVHEHDGRHCVRCSEGSGPASLTLAQPLYPELAHERADNSQDHALPPHPPHHSTRQAKLTCAPELRTWLLFVSSPASPAAKQRRRTQPMCGQEPMVVWGGNRAIAMPFRCEPAAMRNNIGSASLPSGPQSASILSTWLVGCGLYRLMWRPGSVLCFARDNGLIWRRHWIERRCPISRTDPCGRD